MRKPLVIILLLLTAVSALAQSVLRTELDNGLVIVAAEVHANPTVTIRVYVRTGGVIEGPYQGAGISHYYEHLHGDGSESYTQEELDTWDETLGGISNAYTSSSHTCYHQTSTVEHFDGMVALMAETLLRQVFTAEAIASQRGIILKEMNMNLDEADTRAWYRFSHTIYPGSPAADPVIGYPDLFKAVTEADLRDYYTARYTPENMVVVVAGDLDAEEMTAKVAAEFGGVERSGGTLPVVERPANLPGPRYCVEYATFDQAHLVFGFRTVPIWADDLYALDVAMHLLTTGRTSRLYRALLEERQLATDFGVYSYTPTFDAGEFEVYLAADPARLPEAYRTAYDEVTALTDGLADPGELERVKNLLLADYIFDGESLDTRAARLGTDALLGDLEFSAGYVDGCRAVTAEAVRDVARRYFTPDNLYVAVVWPTGAGDFDLGLFEEGLGEEDLIESGLSAEARGLAASVESRGMVKPGQPDAYFVYQGKTPAAASVWLSPDYPLTNTLALDYPEEYAFEIGEGGKSGRMRLTTLDSGLRLLVLEDPGVGSAWVGALVDGGYRVEAPEDEGAFHFAMRMLLEGTGTRTGPETVAAIEDRGGSIGSQGLRDCGLLSAHVPAADAPLALEIVTDCLRNAIYPPDRVEAERRRLLDELAREDEEPFTVAFREAKRAFFGDHPYSHNQRGTPETVAALTRERLLDYRDLIRRPEGTLIAVAGDVDARKIEDLVERLWEDVPAAGTPLPECGPPKFPEENLRLELPSDREQTILDWLWPGMSWDGEDRYRMRLLDAVLSGIYLPNGRLHAHLRGAGLVYAVHAYPIFGMRPGAFALYLGTEPGKTAEAVGIVDEELERIAAEPVGEAELERGRTMLEVSRYVIDLARPSDRLLDAAFYELWGLGYAFEEDFTEEVEGVTAEDLQDYARWLFSRPGVFLRYGAE
ncbi:MAG TPA: pitrilysin family protein [bacterium]|nr:pitrilysin family protein [bacterium]